MNEKRLSDFMVILKQLINGLILSSWLIVGVVIGIGGWIVIEGFANSISSSKSYKELLSEMANDSKNKTFIEDNIPFKSKEDLLKYVKDKQESTKDELQKSNVYTSDNIVFKNKNDMLSYVKEKHGKNKEVPQLAGKFIADNIVFKNKEDMLSYAKEKQSQKVRLKTTADKQEKGIAEKILEWFQSGGSSQRILLTIMTAFSFGVIGSIIDILKKIVNKEVRLEDVKIFVRPLFGGLVAFIILGTVELIPIILQANTAANVARPATLFFFCLFGGIMSTNIFNWANKMIKDFLKI